MSLQQKVVFSKMDVIQGQMVRKLIIHMCVMSYWEDILWIKLPIGMMCWCYVCLLWVIPYCYACLSVFTCIYINSVYVCALIYFPLVYICTPSLCECNTTQAGLQQPSSPFSAIWIANLVQCSSDLCVSTAPQACITNHGSLKNHSVGQLQKKIDNLKLYLFTITSYATYFINLRPLLFKQLLKALFKL